MISRWIGIHSGRRRAVAPFAVSKLIVMSLFAVTLGALVFNSIAYLLWYYEARRRGAARIRSLGPGAGSAWIAEWLTTVVAIFMLPFGWLPARRPVVATAGRRPVLLVHGFLLNRALLGLLAARLRRDGFESYSFNFPTLGSETDAKAKAVAGRIRELAAATGAHKVDVVAHGLGGVLVRGAVRFHGAGDVVGNVVTLAAPHAGSAAAVLFRRWGLLQLRPDSRFLQRLSDEEAFVDGRAVTSIHSDFDAVVFPEASSELEGALEVSVSQVGHMRMLFAERVYTVVKENIDAEPSARPGAHAASA